MGYNNYSLHDHASDLFLVFLSLYKIITKVPFTDETKAAQCNRASDAKVKT
jgi:hypothetical protein